MIESENKSGRSGNIDIWVVSLYKKKRQNHYQLQYLYYVSYLCSICQCWPTVINTKCHCGEQLDQPSICFYCTTVATMGRFKQILKGVARENQNMVISVHNLWFPKIFYQFEKNRIILNGGKSHYFFKTLLEAVWGTNVESFLLLRGNKWKTNKEIFNLWSSGLCC